MKSTIHTNAILRGSRARSETVLRSFLFLLAAAMAPASVFSKEGASEWQFAVSVYGWFPDIGGHTDMQLVGGGDINVDVGTLLDHLKMTWQATLGVAYAFGWGDLGAEWRYLDYDLEGSGPIRSLAFSGPAVGVMFRW